MKKLCITAAMLCLASTAMADFMPTPYLGAGLGIVTNADSHFGVFRGMPFRVLAGYGGIVNSRFYLAGEVSATLTTGKLVDSSYGLESEKGFMISALPGFMVNDYTVGFMRVGAVRTEFKEPNEWISGAQLGLGLTTSVAPNVLLRAEYNITSYNDLHRAGQKRSPRTDGGNFDLIYTFG